MEKALIVGDVQIPFHDPSALEVAMQIGEDLKPDILVINGDWVEWRHLSLKYPVRQCGEEFGKDAIDEARSASTLLEEFTKRVKPKKKVFQAGNHEFRLFRALSQIPQVGQLLKDAGIRKALSVEAVLGLEGLGYSYSGEYPAGSWLFDRQPQNNAFIHHSYITRKKAGYAAHAEIDTRLCSTVTGHGERLAVVWRRGMGRRLFAAEGGNLSILGIPQKGQGKRGSVPFNQPEFLDTQQGFIIITCDGNDLFPEPIAIHNGKAHFRGKIYRA